MINTTNYEAFYLDFLEGNLNEADTALLLSFLDQNPELKLEVEEFESLNDVTVSLDNSYKQSLKQVLFDEDSISSVNINSFLIAQTEGILSVDKVKELEIFIALNPIYENDQKLFKACHLKPNHTEIFTDKASLKKGRKIVLWPYFSAMIAAGIALLLTFGNITSLPKDQVTANSNGKTPFNKPNVRDSISTPKSIENKTIGIKEIQNSISVATNIETEINEYFPQKEEIVQREMKSVIVMKTRSANNFDLMEKFLEPEIASVQVKPVYKLKTPENNYTLLGFNDMENPIEPITNKLANIVKKDIDFRTKKATRKHSGGFYLKIGKLVISHSKS